jgi:hypothetical protein
MSLFLGAVCSAPVQNLAWRQYYTVQNLCLSSKNFFSDPKPQQIAAQQKAPNNLRC